LSIRHHRLQPSPIGGGYLNHDSRAHCSWAGGLIGAGAGVGAIPGALIGGGVGAGTGAATKPDQ
jgi:hypothetical protein